MKNKKSEALRIVVIIVLLVIIRIGFIAFRGEIDKEYYLSTKYNLENAESIACDELVQRFVLQNDRLDRLDSLEVIFNSIPNDKKGTINIAIYSDNLQYIFIYLH